ncbi:MFS transporter [Kribbella sp. ALI-6-A]|uniref:MFS transporter n=1 Tax=Kribbella sp. ALI-6-A TaxID=1933817 RepID=UPI00097C3E78|nr:MFS transporter [Kribbella sp. ALI-6-A]ONI75798.1 MFS transporter [Kribbella sp. ALI-6-A]
MYLANSRAADQATRRVGGTPRWHRVPGNVLALGVVSLVTDISAEMVTAILPLYLVLGLGLNPLQFGLLDGLYAGSTALLRLVGGHAADRWRRLKAVAGIGYGLSAICKLGLLAAGSSVAAIGAVLAVDRAGKGIRTAPRDALISLSSEPETLGRSFGVHRALDTFGAFLGPLVAVGVLWASLGDYGAVFVASFCIAGCGVLLLVLLVKDLRPGAASAPSLSAGEAGEAREPVPLRTMIGLLTIPSFRRCCGWAAALGLVTITDSFVYLALQRRWEIESTWFPLLALGTTGSFLILAVPLGRLADRVGRWKVFLAGHAALVIALLLICGPATSNWIAVVALALHGCFYAATDGVLPATAGPLLPEHLRATGLALLQTGQALARMVSAVLVGLVWTVWDLRPALIATTVALLLVTVAAAAFKPWEVKR